jgi:hypothetical protein
MSIVTSVYSGPTLVFPATAPVVTIAPTSAVGYVGAVTAFTANGSGAGGITYQWNVGGVAVGGQTTSSYSHTAVTNGEIVTCTVTDIYGQATISLGATITVYAALTSVIAPDPSGGIDGTAIVYTCTPGGGDGAYTYEWYRWDIDLADNVLLGITTPTLSKTMVLAETGDSIWCRVASAGSSADSNLSVMTVSLPAAPTVTITMTPASVIEGAVLNFAATGVGAGTLTYQWNLAGVAIAGATLVTYARTTVLADNSGVITCTVTDVHAQTGVSAGQTMVVAIQPRVHTIAMAPASVSEGGVLTFTSTGNGVIFEWYVDGAYVAGGNPYTRTTTLADNGLEVTCWAYDEDYDGGGLSNSLTMVVTPALPGFEWNYPLTQAQVDQAVPIGSTVEGDIALITDWLNLQYSNTSLQGFGISVAVTPGVPYTAELANVSAFLPFNGTTLLGMGAALGGEELGTFVFTTAQTGIVNFTPVTGTVWLNLLIKNSGSLSGIAFSDMKVVPA